MNMNELRERVRETRLMLGEPEPEIVAAERNAKRDREADASKRHCETGTSFSRRRAR